MSKISFYNLINQYQVEIPVIQRDYAQGRDNTKAKDVRKSIVSSMIDSIRSTNKTLFFDFIYGRVESNNAGLEKKFIPFDGQQRLTTLFLFHKYIFDKCGFDTEVLKNFTYKTRMSSKEFCEKLIQEKIIPSGQESLYDYVKNMSWFYSDWEKDPTIVGMLRMLEEIHTQMKDYDFNDFNKDKLISDESEVCSITFELLDMGENNLSDDTYIKMNSRGKVLTAFENFKASLEEYLTKHNKELSKEFEDKLDVVWLEHFWDIINDEGKKELPDSAMLSFFNRHIKNVWNCYYEKMSNKEKEDNSKIHHRIDEELILYPNNDSFISWDIYEFIFDKCTLDKCIKPIFKILNKLCKEKILELCQPVWGKGNIEWDLYNGDMNNKNTETYPSRVAFYALLKYFEKTASTDNLQDWMRVVWNIIENSTIDSMQTYQSALKLIEKLSRGCDDINTALADDLGNELKNSSDYHASEQVKEEIEKVNQFNDKEKGQEWKKKILEAEKYGFFKGLIRFLYINENGVNWNDFDKKWENVKKLVPEDKDERETIYKLIPYLSKSEDIMTIFSDRNISNSDRNLKQILVDYPDKLHNFLMQQNKIENLSLLQKDIMLLCKIKDYENYWIHKKWVNNLNVLSNYSVRRWGSFENASFLVGNSGEFLREGVDILRGLNIKLEDNNKILSENGHEIIKGLYINFIYEKEGEHYFFRWQSNGWVDMYNCYWKENLWNEGNHLHSEYSTENGDYKFNDADGLIQELNRCISEYK